MLVLGNCQSLRYGNPLTAMMFWPLSVWGLADHDFECEVSSKTSCILLATTMTMLLFSVQFGIQQKGNETHVDRNHTKKCNSACSYRLEDFVIALAFVDSGMEV